MQVVGKMLTSSKTWVPLLAVGVLAFFYFLVNFGAARDPVGNTRDLPVAIVNRDKGASLEGKRVEFGKKVVERATTSEEIGDKVRWTRLDSRGDAVRGISEGKYYGALVIPEDYSKEVARLAGPPELPVAIVNEDEGATMGGGPVNFGERVVEAATSEKKLEGVIHWREVPSAQAATEGFAAGKYAAAIVLPEDYSERLVSLTSPTAGIPDPAHIELLTNPAVDPSTLGAFREVYSGIVGSASEKTGAKLSGALAQAGAVVPAQQAALLGDPVRQEVEEAHPAGGAKAPESTGGPEPAHVEILTNLSAGPFPAATVRTILTGVVQNASDTTGGRLTGALTERGATIPPERAEVLGDPVQATLTNAQPIGENSGRGLMPFYLVFTALILGFIGANAIFGGLTAMVESLSARAGYMPPRVRLIFAAAVLGLVLALLLGAVEALVAFGFYGVHHEARAFYVFLFLALIAAVSLFLALVLLSALGPRGGILTGSLLIISVGLATSGGTTPVENLPAFFRALSSALPFEYMTEGTRALLFYGGRLDAGLSEALRVLLAYLVGAVVLGGSISLARDRLARKVKP